MSVVRGRGFGEIFRRGGKGQGKSPGPSINTEGSECKWDAWTSVSEPAVASHEGGNVDRGQISSGPHEGIRCVS